MSDKGKDIPLPFSVKKYGRDSASANSSSADQTDDHGRFLCGDLNIRIDGEGTWFYNGTPIGRKELVRLFSSVLQKDDENHYWLVTPAEKGRIIVEDVPFIAVELFAKGRGKEQCLEFRTNIDEFVKANSSHPLKIKENIETREPSPYILVRENLEAKLTRPVFYQLVDLGVEERIGSANVFGVWSNDEFFKIGRLEE